MIYLDVTSAATYPMNMGVQRGIRGIHECLRIDSEVLPIVWNFSSRSYARLSFREQRHLEQPFLGLGASTRRLLAWSRFWIAGFLRDWWSRGERCIPIDSCLSRTSILLIPDLCWDRRIDSWEQVAKLLGKKVAIFHDAIPLRIQGESYSRDRRLVGLFSEYVRQLGFMDLVICVSRETEQDLKLYWREAGVTVKPTAVLPWPVPFAGSRPRNPPNRAAANLIYISRLRLRKNHLILLEACEMLWREGLVFSLDLVGVADTLVDSYKILSEVRKLKRLGRSVRWRYYISDEKLHQAYRDSSFTLFPSKMEGFGLPIIESLWHRRSVICGSNGAIGEVASGGGCLQVNQNDPVELAGAIRCLLTDAPMYERLYREAGERSFRTWDDYRRELNDLLKTCIEA